MLHFNPTHFGVEVSGIDLSRPLDATTQQALRDAYNEYGVVVFHDQKLTKQQLVEASRAFGDLEIHPLANAIDKEIPEITVISTRGVMGDVEPENDDDLVGKIKWHMDHT